jgi:hypothetical protein
MKINRGESTVNTVSILAYIIKPPVMQKFDPRSDPDLLQFLLLDAQDNNSIPL